MGKKNQKDELSDLTAGLSAHHLYSIVCLARGFSPKLPAPEPSEGLLLDPLRPTLRTGS